MPQNPRLHLAQGEILPATTNPLYTQVYVTKKIPSSRASSSAPLLLGAVGSSYPYKSKSYDPNCPPGTTPKRSHASGWGQTGLGLGLGLLGSQATSSRTTKTETVAVNEPTGLAASFDVTGHEKELKKCLLRSDIVNKDTRQSLSLTLPVRFNLDLFSLDSAGGAGRVVGGEWQGQQKKQHPDFLWWPTSKPQSSAEPSSGSNPPLPSKSESEPDKD